VAVVVEGVAVVVGGVAVEVEGGALIPMVEIKLTVECNAVTICICLCVLLTV